MDWSNIISAALIAIPSILAWRASAVNRAETRAENARIAADAKETALRAEAIAAGIKEVHEATAQMKKQLEDAAYVRGGQDQRNKDAKKKRKRR